MLWDIWHWNKCSMSWRCWGTIRLRVWRPAFLTVLSCLVFSPVIIYSSTLPRLHWRGQCGRFNLRESLQLLDSRFCMRKKEPKKKSVLIHSGLVQVFSKFALLTGGAKIFCRLLQPLWTWSVWIRFHTWTIWIRANLVPWGSYALALQFLPILDSLSRFLIPILLFHLSPTASSRPVSPCWEPGPAHARGKFPGCIALRATYLPGLCCECGACLALALRPRLQRAPTVLASQLELVVAVVSVVVVVLAERSRRLSFWQTSAPRRKGKVGCLYDILCSIAFFFTVGCAPSTYQKNNLQHLDATECCPTSALEGRKKEKVGLVSEANHELQW